MNSGSGTRAGMTLAAKCAPDESLLDDIAGAGIGAVELYTDAAWLSGVEGLVKACGGRPLRYAVHAPNDLHDPRRLAALVEGIGAEAVVFHDIYFDGEWEEIISALSPLNVVLCMENVTSAIEPLKFMRRYGLRRCLDLEHLQMECSGVYEDVFLRLIEEAAHVHLSGYHHGSALWHSHIHHSPGHGLYMLGLLGRAGYSGMVVSEASVKYQSAAEFRALADFFREWAGTCEEGPS